MNASSTPATPGAADEFMERCFEELQQKTQAQNEKWGITDAAWNLDLNAGTIEFSRDDESFGGAIQVIGTYDTTNSSFMWGWEHPSVPQNLQAGALAAKQWGESVGKDIFSRQVLPDVPDDFAWYVTALSLKLTDSEFAYRAPAGGSTHVYLIVDQIGPLERDTRPRPQAAKPPLETNTAFLSQLTRAVAQGIDHEPLLPTAWLAELAQSELFIVERGDLVLRHPDYVLDGETALPVWFDRDAAESFLSAIKLDAEVSALAGRNLFETYRQWPIVVQPDTDEALVVPPQLTSAMLWTRFQSDAAWSSADNNDYVNWVIAEAKEGRERFSWIADALLASDLYVPVTSVDPVSPVLADDDVPTLAVYAWPDPARQAARSRDPKGTFPTISGADILGLARRLNLEQLRVVTYGASYTFSAQQLEKLSVLNA